MRLPSLPGSRPQGPRSAAPVLQVAYPTLEAQSATRRAPVPPPAPEQQEPQEQVAPTGTSIEARVEAAPEEPLETQVEPKPRGAFAAQPEVQPEEPVEAHLDAKSEEPLSAEVEPEPEEHFDEEYGSEPEDIVAEYLRTARTQYVESELHAPLRSILFGSVGWALVRTVLLVLVLIAYNAGLGYMAWRAWGAVGAGNDRLLVPLVIGIGAVLGWIAADVEHAYRSRSRFYT